MRYEIMDDGIRIITSTRVLYIPDKELMTFEQTYKEALLAYCRTRGAKLDDYLAREKNNEEDDVP